MNKLVEIGRVDGQITDIRSADDHSYISDGNVFERLSVGRQFITFCLNGLDGGASGL